jgi:hypothetical protein
MKKGTSFILLFAAILGITFSSCKLKIEDESLYDKPAVHVTENQVTVVISKVNVDTNYINIYRRDKQNDVVYNIGILFHPEALVNDNKNYIYVDTLVKENHSYDYRVRYRINDEYFYSEWSDIIEIKTGYKAYDEDKNLTYQKEANTQFLYEKQDKTLEIQGTIHDPDFDEFTTENYKPMLIIQSNTKTQAFELPASFIAGTSQLELRGVLPNDFLDTDISIKGIVAQKTIFADDDTTKPDEDRAKKIIIWTEPLELDIVGAGSSKTIYIPSQSGTAGLDYSRTAK